MAHTSNGRRQAALGNGLGRAAMRGRWPRMRRVPTGQRQGQGRGRAGGRAGEWGGLAGLQLQQEPLLLLDLRLLRPLLLQLPPLLLLPLLLPLPLRLLLALLLLLLSPTLSLDRRLRTRLPLRRWRASARAAAPKAATRLRVSGRARGRWVAARCRLGRALRRLLRLLHAPPLEARADTARGHPRSNQHLQCERDAESRAQSSSERGA